MSGISAFIWKWWLQKRNKILGGFDFEEKIGDFTFRELYNALISTDATHYEPVKHINAKPTLMLLFIFYLDRLNTGISNKDENDLKKYLFELSPKLLSYGLVEFSTNGDETIFRTSPFGFKFFSPDWPAVLPPSLTISGFLSFL